MPEGTYTIRVINPWRSDDADSVNVVVERAEFITMTVSPTEGVHWGGSIALSGTDTVPET